MICVGSSVPADVFEWGHEIIPGTEDDSFGTHGDGSANTYWQKKRCRRCASTLYHWREDSNFKIKGAAAFRAEAAKLVEKGEAPNHERARALLYLRGVNADHCAAVMFDAVGLPCPGLCCYMIKDDTAPLGRRIEPHIIQGRHDVEFDWRDPRYSLTPENSGALDPVCNRQKHDTPWPIFIARQRAIRVNLEQARAFDPPLRLFELAP